MLQRLRQLVWLLPFALVACDSGREPSAPAFLEFQGASTYVRSFGVDGEPDVYVDTFDVEVTAENLTLQGRPGLTEVTATSRLTGERARIWYLGTDEALLEVAYDCPQLAGPALRQAGGHGSLVHPLARRDGAMRVACSGEPVFWNQPAVVYQLPLEIGARWNRISEPVHIERHVSSFGPPFTATDSENVYSIETSVSTGGAAVVRWIDYVSPGRGLVHRRVSVTSQVLNDKGEPVGVSFTTTERVDRIQ